MAGNSPDGVPSIVRQCEAEMGSGKPKALQYAMAYWHTLEITEILGVENRNKVIR